MESYREIGKRLSNWGRWDRDGIRDERGTTNLLTPERVAAAARLAVDGRVFDLGIPFGQDGPQPGGKRINPMITVTETGVGQGPGSARYADDYVYMPLQAATQWDGLGHVFYDDLLYNGFPASSVSAHGAAHDSIEHQSHIAGRGVLVDVPRHRGVDWLRAGDAIGPDELDACLAAQGVELRGGDVLALRTGWRRKFLADGDATDFMAGEPGLGLACCDWLHVHDVAAVCADNYGLEVLPSEGEPDAHLAVHMVLIRDMGMTIGEIFDFEELAEDCARDGRYEFFFTGPAIKFRGGLGSPVNALAIK